ncbi:MAG: hypothetical protein HZA52_03285 [Planctomycetes bacterium]|nr:hypothetical protein [Planctomycetota bacterium]
MKHKFAAHHGLRRARRVAGAAGFPQYGSRDPAEPFTTSLSNAVQFQIEP